MGGGFICLNLKCEVVLLYGMDSVLAKVAYRISRFYTIFFLLVSQDELPVRKFLGMTCTCNIDK